MALLLEEGLLSFWSFGFIEISVTSAVICAKNLVKRFLRMFILPMLELMYRIVPSYIYGFPGLSRNMPPVLVYNCKFRYISFRVVMGYTILEYSTGR